MLLPISLSAALAGVGLAGAAALLADTGVDGTPGGFLALIGAVGATLALGLLVTGAAPPRIRGMLKAVAGLAAILTAVAAFFLMQDALLAAMAVSLVALVFSAVTAKRKTV